MEYRGTITRILDNTLGDLEEAFCSLYTEQDFYGLLDELREMDEDERPSALRRMYRMLDASGIEYEKRKTAAYYAKLIQNSELPTPEDIEQKMLAALYERFEDFPEPEDFMRRMVRKFSLPEDNEVWGNDSLRLRILKQFMKYGDGLRAVGYKGDGAVRKYAKDRKSQMMGAADRKLTEEEVLNYLDDGVFACLEQADKSQMKPEGTYGLLKLSDDLAGGRFRTQGATRRGLYAFAVVFGMTYYVDGLGAKADEASIPRYESDIDKNLFRDYYTNNLMRFVRASYREQAGSYERNPSGQGINYKNFAEMIYLYYLARDMRPQEKLQHIGEMTERVKKTCEHKGAPAGAQPSVTAEELLSLPPEAFEAFLCEHYNCDIYSMGNYPVGVFQLESAQDAAFAEYKELLQAIAYMDQSPEDCNYGLWFADVQSFYSMSDKELCEMLGSEDAEKARAFVELLLSVDGFLGGRRVEKSYDDAAENEFREVAEAKNPLMFIEQPQDMTRTALITAWYYYYNRKNEIAELEVHRNFAETYEDFRAGLDPILERAGYQKMTSKSIFDILVAFSAYAYAFM